MPRYTKKDSNGRYYIESVNGKLESNIKGHTYGKAIDQLAKFENATVDIKTEVARQIFEEIDKRLDELMVIVSPNDGFITTFRKTMEKVTVEIDELKNKYTKEGVGE